MRTKQCKAVWIGIAAAVLIMRGVPVVRADDADYKTLYEEQKKRSDDLEKRISALEGASTQNVAVAKADITQKSLDFLGQTEISGFVSSSYLYDFDSTHGSRTVAGRSFDTHANQFALNKFKLALEKPIDYNPTNWVAGYRADLIFGQDAAVIHSTSPHGGTFNLGTDGDLEQAFVDLNIPIGNGLKVIVGKTVTLMGVEVIEEVANPNWSEGNQFLFVENFTQTGVQLAYKWNDKIDTEFVVFNGWDQLPDNNTGLSYMGRLGYALDSNTTVAVLGYGGPEQTTVSLGGTSTTANWRDGVELVANHKFTDKLNSFVQLDYGREQKVVDLGDSEWVAAGLWLTYDFTDKIELAFRQDYLKDKDGVRTSGIQGLPVFAPGNGPELCSSTLTLNYKPIDNVQIRPEVRWDHSDEPGTYNGNRDQFTIGMGVAYLY
ncbi:MAG TPA: outer membrane beta-barrel protein [Verrucomicrobiae bacterium]|nr:outer membrane beta-barrel protein [Verrucomicrobiae bacterium]